MITAPSLESASERELALDGFTQVRGITTPANDLRPVRSDPELRGGVQPCAAPLFADDVSFHAAEVARV